MNDIKKLLGSPLLWLFLLIMIGAWFFCWGIWGGEINTTFVPFNEAGLGINPPKL